MYPSFLPGERELLFSVEIAGEPASENRIVVLSLDSGRKETLVEGSQKALYAASGHLIYGREGEIFAAPSLDQPSSLVVRGCRPPATRRFPAEAKRRHK